METNGIKIVQIRGYISIFGKKLSGEKIDDQATTEFKPFRDCNFYFSWKNITKF